MHSIIIATVKSWNIKNAEIMKRKYKNIFDIFLITKKEDLNIKKIHEINPKYIFFPHWSWIISKEIYENYNCILFHMTDLPYGRGGSPLQNLIISGEKNTKISAIKVIKGIDAGPVYLKSELNLSKGSAEEIYMEISDIVFQRMIPEIIEKNIIPVEQFGEDVVFKRRTPEQSNLSDFEWSDLDNIYDFIRMLDAEDYPKAFIEKENLKIEFSEVSKKEGKLVGRFEIYEK